MMDKEVYEIPKIEIICFEIKDIIETSGEWDTDIDTDM